MHRASSSSSRSSKPSSSRSKTSGSSSSSARGRSSHRSRSRSRSPRSRRRHRSPSSRRSSRRSPPSSRSSRRHSPGKRSQSPGKRSRSPGKCSPSLSDENRDELADGPIFTSDLSRPQSTERYSLSKETPSSPFNTGHDEDYRFRDDYLHQSKYSTSYNHLQNLPSEAERYDMLLGKQSEDRGQDLKLPQYDTDDRLFETGIEPKGFLSGTWNICKQDASRSPTLPFRDEDLRVLEYARRKSEEEGLRRNFSEDPIQSPEPKYLYRPNERQAMPKKSILKKPRDDPTVQPEVFSSNSASLKEPHLLSDDPPFPQRTNSIAPFSTEEVKFLKQFNKKTVVGSAYTVSDGTMRDWKLHSGQEYTTSNIEQNFGSFLNQSQCHEPEDQQSDFLLPHERASQDGNGFSRILGMQTDSTSAQGKKRHSFLDDVEDEEKFLYGDNEDDSIFIQRITLSGDKEHGRRKINSPPVSPSVKSDTLEESRPEYEKIYDLLRTIGLDIGVAEIGKLAARTQERLHGKKASRSPDRHSVASRKSRKEFRESRERHCSRSDTHSPESRRNHSLSPSGSFPPYEEMFSASHFKYPESKISGQEYHFPQEQAVPMISPVPSAPPCLPHMFPSPINPQYSIPSFLPFGVTHVPQNYSPPTMPPPNYNPYEQYVTYAAASWSTYPPPQQADPEFPNTHGYDTPKVPPNHSYSNLKVIQTVSTTRRISNFKRKKSVCVQIPYKAPCSKLLPQPTSKATKKTISDDRNRASQKQKLLEERGKLKPEQEARRKKLHYLTIELNRLTKQEGKMLRNGTRTAEDPLLVEVSKLRNKIADEVAELKIHSDAAEKKLSELDKVAQILGINIFEKARKQSSENKDSSEKDSLENGKNETITCNSIQLDTSGEEDDFILDRCCPATLKE